jgi:hypothetical protein
MVFTSVSASVTHAINFLTLPLILTQTADLVTSLQSILRGTLPAALAPCGGQGTLSFSPTAMPPRPILAACIACDFLWADWMTLLGNRDFDLTIELHDVLVTYFDLSRPYTITIWSEPTPSPITRPLLARFSRSDEIPISKLGQKSRRHIFRKATVNNTLSYSKTRTLAQQLLEENYKQEADEIFDMISKTSIMSPTPTSQEFPILRLPSLTTVPAIQSPLSYPEISSPSESSRPSSRSSTFSSFFSDDEESITSGSSTTSLDSFTSVPKSPQPKFLDKRSPAFVPRRFKSPTQGQEHQQQESPEAIVDANKNDKTKYLYQGGYTTVVTGGVMLGSVSTAAQIKGEVAAPKYHARVGSRNRFPASSIPSMKSASGFGQNWRRAATTRV